MKIIKFKKDHVGGFKKGDVRQVNGNLSDRLIKEKFAEESDAKALDAFKEKLAKQKPANDYAANKKLVNDVKNPCEGCNDPDCEDCNDEDDQDPADDKNYHALTAEDIEANPEAAEGLEAGTEVEMNEEEALIVGEDGKFIVKPSEGND